MRTANAPGAGAARIEYNEEMALVKDAVEDVADWVDRRLLAGFYTSVSVSTERERERLRRAARPFHDPRAEQAPRQEEVELTAEWVIAQSVANMTVLGGFAGLAGAVSVPPEVMATSIAWVRLSQRLAVVYGLDPETDRGQLAMWRALEAALDLQLPEGGPLGVRVSDLPRVLLPQAPKKASVAVTRGVVRQTAWLVVGRLGRLVPVISLGVGAIGARQRTRNVGQRMREVFGRLCEEGPELGILEEAVEVQRS